MVFLLSLRAYIEKQVFTRYKNKYEDKNKLCLNGQA